jgi:NAD(P)-dependent dehydrogenase (short-subunit alcohol dehydrogenase family)
MNVVIVGCGNVGLETARRLCRGHVLLLVNRSNSPGVQDLLRGYSNLSFVSADATDAETMKRITADFVSRVGRLDALISTVGAFCPASAVDDFPSFENNFALNVFGNLSPIQAVLDHVIARRSGKIIVLSSTSGVFAYRGLTPYVPAKWALTSLCTTLRHELERYGVSLDTVFPASIRNQHSHTFLYEKGIEVGKVVDEICRALEAHRGTDRFVPRHKAMLRPLERMFPQALDRRAGLKSARVQRFRSHRVRSVLIAGASSGLHESLARLYAQSAGKVYLAEDKPIDQIVADSASVDLLVNVGFCSPTGRVENTTGAAVRTSLKAHFVEPVRLVAGLLHRGIVPRKIIVVLCSSSVEGKAGCGGCGMGHAAMWGFTRALRRTIGNETQVMEVGMAMCPAQRGTQNGTRLSDAALAQRIVLSEQAGKEIVSLAV